jgi:hypothetical protein
MRALVDVGIFYTMFDGKSFVIAHFYNRTVGIYQSIEALAISKNLRNARVIYLFRL